MVLSQIRKPCKKNYKKPAKIKKLKVLRKNLQNNLILGT